MTSFYNIFFTNNTNEDEEKEDVNLETYLEKNTIIPINGNGNEYSTCFAKLLPCGIKYIQPWGLNRPLDSKFIEDIVKNQEEFYNINKRYNFIDPIHISKCDDKYQLLDGQHRLDAYQKLHHKNDLPRMPVIIHNVKDQKENIQIFRTVNKRAYVKMEELHQDKLNELTDKMNKHWLAIFIERKKRIPNDYNFKTIFGINRPYMDENKFCRTIRETNTFKNKTVDEIMNILVRINNNIKDMNVSKRGKGITPLGNDKCDCFGFYLGCDKDMNWMKDI
jgi:hypothetical protein